MTAIELLRRGLQTGDWVFVGEGFFLLTGERPALPAAPAGDDAAETLNAIEALLSRRRPSAPPTTAPAPAPTPAAPPESVQNLLELGRSGPRQEDVHVEVRPVGTKTGGGAPFRKPSGPNRFEDDGTIAADEVKYCEKIQKPSRTARPEHFEIEATCFKCGQQESIPPALAPRKLDAADESFKYVCNRCIVKGAK